MSSAQGRLRGHKTDRQAQLVQGLGVPASSLVCHLLSLPPGPSLQGETHSFGPSLQKSTERPLLPCSSFGRVLHTLSSPGCLPARAPSPVTVSWV